MTGPTPVTLLVSHLVPTLGLEACVLRLERELGGALDIVCIGEDPEHLARSDARAATLGPALRGWRRVASLPRLWRWVRHVDGTVIAAGAWAAIPLLLVVGRHGPRVIVWEHSFSREKTRSARGLRVLSLVARLAYRRADAVVCVSEDLRSQVGGWVRHARVVTIPNYLPDHGGADAAHVTGEPGGTAPADLGRGEPTDGRPGRRLLSVGSLSPTKNHRLLLEAMRHLDDSYVLAIAGAGELRDELAGLVTGWGLEDRVTFLGHRTDVDHWYRWCDVVVQPALGETFGLAMFEAAAHHRPVVSVDYELARSLVPEMIPGTLTPPTAEAMAAAVRRTVSTPLDEDELTRADRRRADLFAAPRITRAWQELLSSGAPATMGHR